MSKPLTRIALAALISLAVIVGIYSSVQGAAPDSAASTAGSHLVSGAKVNLDHFREANPAPAPVQSDFQSGKGHGGCEDELRTSPDD
ncbi:MAG TPA: hypothetical protein VJ785_02245 [Anaerolineales bacterium]|nr:hypothetical protein [Anaerolineales bacterium]